MQSIIKFNEKSHPYIDGPLADKQVEHFLFDFKLAIGWIVTVYFKDGTQTSVPVYFSNAVGSNKNLVHEG
jgi:hypothetical protein